MGLVFPENRKFIDKSKPGMHAFIAGVSSYPHLEGGKGQRGKHGFGMKQLTASALSAYRIHEWIVQQRYRFHPPLASCRLLISPTDRELAVLKQESRDADRLAQLEMCDLDNFIRDAEEWREDAASHPDGMTFFYFAGHGLQTSEIEAALLLQDYNGSGGALRCAVDMDNIYGGMSPTSSRPKIARNQIYFVDACRRRPGDLKNLPRLNATDVFSVEFESESDDDSPIIVDDRIAPVIFAAVPGDAAYSSLNKHTYFSDAVLSCLKGRAGVKIETPYGQTEWQVSAHSISAALKVVLKEIDQTGALRLNHTIRGNDVVLLTLDGPPDADVVLEIDPEEAHRAAIIEVLDNQKSRVWQLESPLPKYPFRRPLPPGEYKVNAMLHPYASVEGEKRSAFPPLSRWVIKVAKP